MADKAPDTVQEPVQKPETLVPIITYNISLFPAAEMRKDLKRRRGQGTYLKLTADEPFDTFKAQLLVKIYNEMKPATLSFDNYIVSFTIPRLSPSPLAITNQKDYEELIGQVKKAKDLTATVYVQEMQNMKKHKEIQSGKENDSATSDRSSSDNSSDNNGKKKRKHKDKRKKTRAPKASDIDESNQPVNKNIRDLRN
ncbi:uncharacterized protein HD556DRAFT_1449597 [Suillus plorans]|uniref:Uncharacterized protein n=1 Tax=Suillus plorans TaxID=116603 RepID=A0A9P7ACJ6_9AGAM|nr:uncharacterized protein HD556DRAFT_1449597 [Suillus plorans]KAG1786504.1 hypothetical protein HD556DRAFT_1449597 [Suillus plorans]